MTLLFKGHHIPRIQQGFKTVTRRPSRPMVKPGGVYRLKIKLFESLPDRIMVDRLYRQRLGDMTAVDAEREGYPDLQGFREEWEAIYGDWDPERVVWVVEFCYLGIQS